jgi:hypothetical protein
VNFLRLPPLKLSKELKSFSILDNVSFRENLMNISVRVRVRISTGVLSSKGIS